MQILSLFYAGSASNKGPICIVSLEPDRGFFLFFCS